MVGRIVAWSLLGFVCLVLLAVGLRSLFSKDESDRLYIGRFQMVRTSPDEIILLDTSGGHLYRAVPDDIKPYTEMFENGDDSDDTD